LSFAAMPGFIVRAVPASETGSATGFYQVLRSIGLSVGSALGAALLTAYTHGHNTYPSVGGFRAALFTASALCAATAVISYVLPGKDVDRPATPADQEAEETAETEYELDGTSVAVGE
jgi:MFS family permease